MCLDGSRLAERVAHDVRRPVVVHALAVEQPAHEHDRLVEPADPLTGRRPERDAEGLVLPLEPGGTDA